MTLSIVDCTFSDIENASTFKKLVEEYISESAIKELTYNQVNLDAYKSLEAAGVLHSIGVFFDSNLIGFALLISPILPHYGVQVTSSDAIFLTKKHRKGGAGLRLIKAVEVYAKRKGSKGVIMSAPVGGTLAEVLPRIGYRETNRIFFRDIK